MTWHDELLSVVLLILLAAFALAVIRLIRGPRLPDRVVALDLLSAQAIGILAVTAVLTRQPVLFDVVTILALVAFLGTVAFVTYLARKEGGS